MTDEGERRTLRVLQQYADHLNPAWVRLFKFAGLETLEVEAEGAIIRDAYGREFLDFAAGPSVFILGHRHPRVVEAARRELDRMPLSVRLMANEPMGELAELLAEVTPGDLQYVFLCNSGAEANEAAIKVARLATGRTDLIAASGAFHGKTLGALSISGRDLYRTPFEPLLPGVVHVPFGDADALAGAVTPRTAAVVLEPIQGETGVVVPPDGYLRAAREVCDRHGVLLVVDEVQTGMGRTGKMWACEHEDVVPDILTTAKGLGGGVAPVGAMVARPPLWEPMIRDPLIHTTTFGNRLGWAAAAATIRVILEENLLPRAAAIGERLMAGLRRAAGDAAGLVTDVRGRGCLVGVEFVDADVAFLVLSGMLQRQVLAFYSTNRREVIRFAPPLIASDAQVDRAIDVFAEALAEAKALVAEVGAG
ncbi:MAG: aspartate aminotransferase family protein [Armatimonadota bacterium]|nr:aspartate aminotransferase family protein [Armatimonadota bacterium]MDR7520296.1 aspartate aminotransferase family protein [Armatimonadota bacterium]